MRLNEMQHTYRTAVRLGWMVVPRSNMELDNRALSVIKALKVHSLSAH